MALVFRVRVRVTGPARVDVLHDGIGWLKIVADLVGDLLVQSDLGWLERTRV